MTGFFGVFGGAGRSPANRAQVASATQAVATKLRRQRISGLLGKSHQTMNTGSATPYGQTAAASWVRVCGLPTGPDGARLLHPLLARPSRETVMSDFKVFIGVVVVLGLLVAGWWFGW